VSTLATDEYPTNLELKLKGKTIEDVTGGNLGAEARLGIAWTEGVGKRGMTLRRFADITATNAARIMGLYPKKGVLAPGSDADIVLMDPTIRRTLTKDDFHVADYSPWEGWPITGWPVLTDPARQGHRRARQAARAPPRTAGCSRGRSTTRSWRGRRCRSDSSRGSQRAVRSRRAVVAR
jgi:hypothetical protein